MVSKFYIEEIKSKLERNVYIYDAKKDMWYNILDHSDCITGKAYEMMIYLIEQYKMGCIPLTLNPFPQG